MAWQTASARLVSATERLLQVAALMLLILLGVKAAFDADQSFDSWWYHLPWAARLAGIVSAQEFGFEPIAAHRFEGFPVLPELLQGLLWRVTGRVESANLLAFGSLLAFIAFLSRFFGDSIFRTRPPAFGIS